MSDLSDSLILFIAEEKLFDLTDRLLVGVSGGADSVLLLHLLSEIGVDCGIAHCNFNLRGKESNDDELFVRELAHEYSLPFHLKSFDTKQYAKKNGISIEMAARDLRYEWFDKIRKEADYKYIAIAHHLDDSIETMLLNLVRGTGIRGLVGIRTKNKSVVRPLLFLKRTEIEQFMYNSNLAYRTDSSNNELIFKRNKIRQQILPIFEELNPKIRQTMQANLNRFAEIETIYLQSIEQKKAECISVQKTKTYININKFKKLDSKHTYLYEFIKVYGFTKTQVDSIIQSLDAESGKKFNTSSYCLIKDRNKLIISEIANSEKMVITINEEQKILKIPLNMQFVVIQKNEEFELVRKAKIVMLDFDKLSFPLTLRKWKAGDWFVPLGMKNRKKVSDFLIDKKIDLIDKQNVYVLESSNNIIWILRHRLDDRYKIDSKTKQIYQITIL